MTKKKMTFRQINFYTPIKVFIVSFLFLIVNHDVFSQTDEKVTVVGIDRSAEAKVELELKARYHLIKLKTHPRLHLDNGRYREYSKCLDSAIVQRGLTIVDSISIVLTSGLSWDLEKGPPEQPKNFHWKLLSKKGRKDDQVVDRMKYNAFVTEWSENDQIPYDSVEKFNRYYAIMAQGEKYVEMIFELKFNDTGGLDTTRKEINFCISEEK